MYKFTSIRVGAPLSLEVFHQISSRHPVRNEPERGNGDTQEENDIRVRQIFPHHSCSVEPLWVSLAEVSGESDCIDDEHSLPPAGLPWSAYNI